MAKKSSTPELDAPRLCALQVSSLAEGKKKYKEADLALDALIAESCEKCKTCGQLIAGQVIELPDAKPIPVELRGKKFKLIDNFAEKTRVGVGLSARRFELEEVTTP